MLEEIVGRKENVFGSGRNGMDEKQVYILFAILKEPNKTYLVARKLLSCDLNFCYGLKKINIARGSF